MTEPVTPNKGYTIPNTGDLVNAWGPVLNANFSTIDNNVSGNTAVAISTGTTTLSSSQAQNLVIQLSGSLSGACTVQLPQKPSFNIFQNSTTANGNVVTVSTGAVGGATVGLPQLGSFPVWTDGTNCYGVAFNGVLHLQGAGTNNPTLTIDDTASSNGAAIILNGPTGYVSLQGGTSGAGVLASYFNDTTYLFHSDTAGNFYPGANLVVGSGKYVQVAGGGGPIVTGGSGAPTANYPAASLYLRTDGAVGSRVYVSQGSSSWLPIAGV